MYSASRTIPYSTQTRYLPIKRNRIWEIDFIRGICVILMILDHFSLLLSDYFARSWYDGLNNYDAFSLFCHNWQNSAARPPIHTVVLIFFFAVSGISCTFSRSNFRRGGQLAILAGIYSFCSLFADKVMGIYGVTTTFGVLDFLAVCMLLYALIERCCKGDPYHIAIVAAGLIGITLILYFCYTPPANTPLFFGIIFPPTDAYGKDALFYNQNQISPGDLFTMIPYTAFYFAGVLLAPFLYGKRRSLLPKLDEKWNKPVCFVGRHALLVYIFHLVILAGLLALISGIFITPGNFGF
ncbi:MAG: DUF1624 domain-containing protein [Bacteroides sp.]|nr:DUF1624 domain-containing protein [Bacillota bacterium]MCM1393488.1 DUF1624 domain-containing protein [[Eubacterium] siraeum]MCM1455310.1 DUF1624 domain-containing protein [Bacteroides sp.]